MHATPLGSPADAAAAWRQDLVLALRLREVPGVRIGEALAEVEAHCADSGQNPWESFGDPDAYAAELAPGAGTTSVRSWLLQAVATPVGVLALLSGTDHTVHGGRPAVTAGGLLSLLVTVSLIAVVVRLLGSLVRHGWWAWLGLSAGIGLATALPVLLQAELTTLPARPVLVAGVLLLAAAWWRPGGAAAAVDEVVDPRTGAPARPVPRGAVLLLRWFFPVVLLAALTLVVLIPA